MNETARHREAFEYYYSLGNDRKLPTVAKRFESGKRTVETWSKEFNWQQRTIDRDKKIADKAGRGIEQSIAQFKAKQLKIINKQIEQYEASGIGPENSTDYDKMVKLALLLRGEATDRTEVKEYVAEWGTDKTD